MSPGARTIGIGKKKLGNEPATMEGLFGTIKPYIQHYGYFAVLVGVMLEDFGLPIPGETLLIAGAVFASQGQMELMPLLFAAWFGAVVGDNIGYAIGRFGGRALVLRYGRYVFIHRKHLDYVEFFFHKYGSIVVAIARFVEILRQLNGIVAGIGRMPWTRFLSFNALGAGLWVGFWGALTYELGAHAERLGAAFGRIKIVAFLGTGLAILGLIFYFYKRHRR
jgi:membrane protein DedA with SNARE-associated domain